MSDRPLEPMTDYEIKLGRELRAASEHALRSFDATVIARSAAGAAMHHRWAGLLERVRPSRLLVAILLALAVLGATLAIGSGLIDRAPTYRLGHLAYELDGDVWIADADGSHAVKIADGVPDGKMFGAPTWSQDGSTLSVSAYDPALEGGLLGPSVFYQADRDGRRVAADGPVHRPGHCKLPRRRHRGADAVLQPAAKDVDRAMIW